LQKNIQNCGLEKIATYNYAEENPDNISDKYCLQTEHITAHFVT